MGCLVKGYLSLNNSKSKTPGSGGLRSLSSGVTGFSSSGGAGMVLECGCKEKPGRVITGKTRDATTVSAAHREILFNPFIIPVFAHVSRLVAPGAAPSGSFRVLQGPWRSCRVGSGLSRFTAADTDEKSEMSSSGTPGAC